MPQLTLKISHNIDISIINFNEIFAAIHQELTNVPNMNVNTAHSGVIHEAYSYIGLGDDKATKVYLELLWLEDSERMLIKKSLANRLVRILEEMLAPQIEKQNLNCVPRVRIGNLGVVDIDYHISKRPPVFSYPR